MAEGLHRHVFPAAQLLVASFFVLSCVHSAHAARTDTEGDAGMRFLDDPANSSRPKLVVAPTYPPALLQKGVTGFVDLEISIGKYGRAERILSAKVTPPEPAFEAAINDVIHLWQFHETLSTGCVPQDSTGNTRIWFDIKDGTPSISVSSRSRTPQEIAAVRPPIMKNRDAVIKQVTNSYPIQARRNGVQALVHVVLHVDGDTGKTLEVKTTANSAPRQYAAAFERNVSEAYSSAEFELESESKGTRYAVCSKVTYMLE